ncbi:MAG TPA: beta-propeller fold lactonase family protein, partial [Isosphaeraceae bacterium]|nr:beta-propeller fold lactonase family protein [Isosphaeraceae bacterium]
MRTRYFSALVALVLGLPGAAWADSLYISSFNNNAVYKVDATTGALQQTISAPSFLVSPSGLALSPDGSRLYVSGTNSSNADVYVFDPASGSLVTQFSSSLTGG